MANCFVVPLGHKTISFLVYIHCGQSTGVTWHSSRENQILGLQNESEENHAVNCY